MKPAKSYRVWRYSGSGSLRLCAHTVDQQQLTRYHRGGLTMRSVSNMWAVILAGGDGSRLREITTTEAGEVIPKQFCSLRRRTCLLEDALERAQAVAIPQ